MNNTDTDMTVVAYTEQRELIFSLRLSSIYHKGYYKIV